MENKGESLLSLARRRAVMLGEIKKANNKIRLFEDELKKLHFIKCHKKALLQSKRLELIKTIEKKQKLIKLIEVKISFLQKSSLSLVQ